MCGCGAFFFLLIDKDRYNLKSELLIKLADDTILNNDVIVSIKRANERGKMTLPQSRLKKTCIFSSDLNPTEVHRPGFCPAALQIH